MTGTGVINWVRIRMRFGALKRQVGLIFARVLGLVPASVTARWAEMKLFITLITLFERPIFYHFLHRELLSLLPHLNFLASNMLHFVSNNLSFLVDDTSAHTWNYINWRKSARPTFSKLHFLSKYFIPWRMTCVPQKKPCPRIVIWCGVSGQLWISAINSVVIKMRHVNRWHRIWTSL